MIGLEFLQNYWWLLISILGALLVFMLFVQGGQSMLLSVQDEMHRNMIVNSLGRKWELTFTMLVVFGGAFFASFPLFYSTSFGGAYWLWMLILVSFVIQAFSYEFRRKSGNIYGTKTYDVFLFLNGCVGCVLLGVAVAMMFLGAEFMVAKGNILDLQAPVISRWSETHGLEAIADWRNLLLGFTVLFLARTQSLLYLINNVDDDAFRTKCRKNAMWNGAVFVVLFLSFMAVLLTHTGCSVDGDVFEATPYKYFINYIDMWWCAIMLVIGVLLVLYGLGHSVFDRTFNRGIWYSGIGTILVVLTFFWVAAYNNTPYYPSLLDMNSSLTIRNSSSSEFTLTVMSWVSLLVPFVVAYIAYVWRAMDKKAITSDEMKSDDHKY